MHSCSHGCPCMSHSITMLLHCTQQQPQSRLSLYVTHYHYAVTLHTAAAVTAVPVCHTVSLCCYTAHSSSRSHGCPCMSHSITMLLHCTQQQPSINSQHYKFTIHYQGIINTKFKLTAIMRTWRNILTTQLV